MMNALKIKDRVTSLDVAVISRELSEYIVNSYIDNVYSGDDPSTLIIKLRLPNGEISNLLIDAGRRVNLTRYEIGKGTKYRVPIFRRFIRNAKVVNVSQHSFERIVEISLIKGGKQLRIIAEVMPRGIITVVNEDGRVLVTNTDLKVKDRKVIAGEKYSYPPPAVNIIKASYRELLNIIRGSKGRLGAVLVTKAGIPPEIVNEVLSEDLRLIKSSEVDEGIVKDVRDRIVSFILRVINSPYPVIVKCGDTPTSFHPFRPSFLGSECEVIHYKTMNEAIDEYFAMLNKVSKERESLEESELMLKRLKHMLDQISKSREEVKAEISRLEKLISAIEENYLILENLWKCVRDAVKVKGWDYAKTFCGVRDVNKNEGVFEVGINGVNIKLSITKPLKETYISLVTRLGRLRKKLKRIEKSIRDVENRIKGKELEIASIKSRRILYLRSDWFTRYHWIITSNGYLAIGGIDSQQNEKIVRKYLSDSDIFLHAEIHGGSAFILKCNGLLPPQKDLMEVATLAASYSKAWREGMATVDVYWVWGRQVSKSPPPGQYLPKGSFMVYGKRNYIKGVKLELAVGVEVINDKYYRVIAGPEELVSNRSKAYAMLTPGASSKEEVVEQIMKFLKDVLGAKYRLEGDLLTAIRHAVPGPSDIVKKKISN